MEPLTVSAPENRTLTFLVVVGFITGVAGHITIRLYTEIPVRGLNSV
jgi:hypothetical protein